MWLFTETGFISAVRHRDLPDMVMIRARDELSLEPIAEMGSVRIEYTPNADYAYRVTVHNDVLGAFMDIMIQEMDYDNFKNRVTKTRGQKFVAALHHVWEIMHNVEDKKAAGRYYDLEEDKYFDDHKTNWR